MLEFDFTKSAQKELNQLPTNIGKRIIEKIIFYCSQTEPIKNAKHLSTPGGKTYRFRIGDYRAIFEVENKGILFTKIEHRKNIYRRIFLDIIF